MSRPRSRDATEALALARSAFNLSSELTHATPLPSYDDQNWLLHSSETPRVVLKVSAANAECRGFADETATLQQLRLENATMRALHAGGVSVPRPLRAKTAQDVVRVPTPTRRPVFRRTQRSSLSTANPPAGVTGAPSSAAATATTSQPQLKPGSNVATGPSQGAPEAPTAATLLSGSGTKPAADIEAPRADGRTNGDEGEEGGGKGGGEGGAIGNGESDGDGGRDGDGGASDGVWSSDEAEAETVREWKLFAVNFFQLPESTPTFLSSDDAGPVVEFARLLTFECGDHLAMAEHTPELLNRFGAAIAQSAHALATRLSPRDISVASGRSLTWDLANALQARQTDRLTYRRCGEF
ncbi:hypothetical protein T492DRAFT_1140007 [Pavlovales sp. CCMP2436]|nr:hypothetical protein T492DRAFT_1140007 [Pavlovales sp. CCMP2436]